jgi:hypothetical protein
MTADPRWCTMKRLIEAAWFDGVIVRYRKQLVLEFFNRRNDFHDL